MTLYAVTAGHPGRIKVGFTKHNDPLSRLESYRTIVPDLKIVWTALGAEQHLENKLHTALRLYNSTKNVLHPSGRASEVYQFKNEGTAKAALNFAWADVYRDLISACDLTTEDDCYYVDEGDY